MLPVLTETQLHELGLSPSTQGEEVRKPVIVEAQHNPVILESDVRFIWF